VSCRPLAWCCGLTRAVWWGHRAYKLGKKRWSYNQCALTLQQRGGFKTLSVAEAMSNGHQSLPEDQQVRYSQPSGGLQTFPVVLERSTARSAGLRDGYTAGFVASHAISLNVDARVCSSRGSHLQTICAVHSLMRLLCW